MEHFKNRCIFLSNKKIDDKLYFTEADNLIGIWKENGPQDMEIIDCLRKASCNILKILVLNLISIKIITLSIQSHTYHILQTIPFCVTYFKFKRNLINAVLVLHLIYTYIVMYVYVL